MRPRNIGFSLVVFAVLAVGALVRIDRLTKLSARRDERFLTLGQLARDLATEKQTFEVVLAKLGAGPNSFILAAPTPEAGPLHLLRCAAGDFLRSSICIAYFSHFAA